MCYGEVNIGKDSSQANEVIIWKQSEICSNCSYENIISLQTKVRIFRGLWLVLEATFNWESNVTVTQVSNDIWCEPPSKHISVATLLTMLFLNAIYWQHIFHNRVGFLAASGHTAKLLGQWALCVPHTTECPMLGQFMTVKVSFYVQCQQHLWDC